MKAREKKSRQRGKKGDGSRGGRSSDTKERCEEGWCLLDGHAFDVGWSERISEAGKEDKKGRKSELVGDGNRETIRAGGERTVHPSQHRDLRASSRYHFEFSGPLESNTKGRDRRPVQLKERERETRDKTRNSRPSFNPNPNPLQTMTV